VRSTFYKAHFYVTLTPLKPLFICTCDYTTLLLAAHQLDSGTHDLADLDGRSLVGRTIERTIGVASDGLHDLTLTGVPDLSANGNLHVVSFRFGESR